MIVVADTGPIVHLHWVGASAWALPPEPILVVRQVWDEVERHAPEALHPTGWTPTLAQPTCVHPNPCVAFATCDGDAFFPTGSCTLSAREK